MATQATAPLTPPHEGSPDNLYHVKRYFWYPTPNHTNSVLQPSIRGTFASLPAAKKFASQALADEGYQPGQFQDLQLRRDSGTEWTFGDDVMVYAKTIEEGTVTVELETTPNRVGKLSLEGPDERVKDSLYFLVQTVIDYSRDWSVGSRRTIVEGVFRTVEEAKEKAFDILLEANGEISRSDFAEYSENRGQDDWEFDDNVLVHAVGQNGLNFLVAIVKGGEP
ncbi:hypothetical protein BFW01_g3833 [Lasiodiplodia theobromae]|uniref:Uncharacterized protein n=2 Tax=Lasiodiplodia TaxID=66739 RepID=A0A5N5DC43_9PEZI|nr:uncharacterized protein LTHEOB_8171 [Lasiodiplodia theobromae]KAB2575245.1 hypothetical protein DBV05_g6175 [Lasiodiplodia theobromae]KAF4542017.1 hypothetical protein LTHEOB_8171 [Lasiodiplodia theobromae]KAF9632970.1 hypothetical protein BFW01_g3833 [Lasiodiplodia theobromae]KAK0640546.1 hypothetical protein DIS24_g9256 [Lasiodiplodia hormozganensis]